MEQNQLTGRLWAISFPRGALLVGLFLIFTNFLVAQQITGTVNDNSGVGIPGVLILVKGTTKGTVTEVNGTLVLLLVAMTPLRSVQRVLLPFTNGWAIAPKSW